jgi:wyosine [tRNA(Phe)-imidazoG37] synthetase (radical SAM superfamily)
MLLTPKPGIIYGPVNSRRLGRSLGINVLPPSHKPCTFDCAYCHFGWTPREPAPPFPAVDHVLREVEIALLRENPAFLTFSGNGEPTTHPHFGDIVDGVLGLRDLYLPAARVAVLSNSTRVGDAGVRVALAKLDVRIMKLDAGTEAVFQSFNRPLDPISLADVVAGLLQIPALTLQTLFAAGSAGNAHPAHVAAWADQVVALAPLAVQIYTLDRDWPSRDLQPVDRATLDHIAAALHARGCPATVFTRT